MTSPAYNSVTATIEGRTGYPQLNIGSSATDTIGFYGTTPVVQPSGSAQAAVSTATISSVATTGSVTTGFGYSTTAQADGIVTAINLLITRVAANTTLNNAHRTALVALGLEKGSA